MKISVVIPCFNAAPYLAQTLGSVLDQTRPAGEIFVVDDGSTDGSLELAQRFPPRLVQVVAGAPARTRSAARARNLGAQLATGDALMFLDADDVLGPDALDALTAALAREPGGVALCPWFRVTLREGRWVTGPPSCVPRRHGQDALAAWLSGWYHPPCSALWSREGFERAGRWDEMARINQDGDLMMRALVHGVPLVETARGATYYRRAPQADASLSGSRLSRQGVDHRIRAVRKVAFLLEARGRLAPYRAPVAAAFAAIAADARRESPDLAAFAASLARRYAPSPLQRTIALARGRRPSAVSQTPAWSAEAGVELRCGFTRAAQVLSCERSSASAGRALVLAAPAVSVIVPTYNRAGVLPRALRSVYAQTFQDFEVLVVDDGSTDETRRTVEALRDPRLRYLRHSVNRGAAAARNHGMRAARADLIAFLDSDDEWFPEKLAEQVARFRALPEDVGLVYTGVVSVATDGSTRYKCSTARGDVYGEMLGANVIHGGGSNVMLRRGVIASAGFFHETLSAIEDYEYWLRVTRFFKVDVIEKPLIRYYDPPEGERRSLAIRANLEARRWFYRTYGAEMRRAGVAQWFLLKTARWALSGPHPDVAAARRFAVRAAVEAPTSRSTLQVVARTLLQSATRGRAARTSARWSRA